MKQTLSVIGASGKMGSAISRSLAKGNYRVVLCGRDTGKLMLLADEIKTSTDKADVEVVDCLKDAGWEADIIILAVPFEHEKEITERLKEVANQKIVISISNPLNESFNGLITHPATSAAEELQQLLPNAKVIKAFNTTFAADFKEPVIDGKQVDAFIAGNDPEALETVAGLVHAAGFNPIVAGDITVSRTLENMQLLLIQLAIKNNYNWLAGWKVLHN